MARTTFRINEQMTDPHWSLLQRQRFEAITDAYLEYYDRSVDLSIVNLDPTRSCSLVVQTGAYCEHRFVDAATNGVTQPARTSSIDLNLGHRAGTRISLRIERLATQPTLSFPW